MVLIFQTGFSDADGDLGHGFLETYIDGNSTSLGGLPMDEIFHQNGLRYDATEGDLTFWLELSVGGDSLPESGTTFTVGVRARDEQENTSNTPEVELELTY